MKFKLNYDELIILDAEDLAETGIKEAYEAIKHRLGQYVAEPAEIEELADPDVPSYTIKCRGVEYPIYSPDLDDEQGGSWARATFAFFKIVNDQLTRLDHRLYAINGGNELSGMFLTKSECEAARRALPHKTDWPYLPTLDDPWYGQPHD
jgi:hypothetical protein